MLSEEVAALVSPGFKFGMDDPAEAEALVELGVGGFCLYGGEVKEVAEFTARLRAKARKPLLFNADYEDGTASQCPGGTHLPSNMGIGASGSEELAAEKGRLTGRESRALGVRWVLAPVVDLATEADNPIVNVRSFGSEAAEVGRLARAYCRGLREAGVLSCLKHFPGHGRTRLDSHLEMPSIPVSRAELEGDLAPFKAVAAEADSLMTGHLSVPALEPDPTMPFSLSLAVEEEVRRALPFGGLISTDALTMHAVSKRFDERQAAERALLGGSDILLVPTDPKRLVYHLMERVETDPALAAAAAAALGRWRAALLRADAAAVDPLAGDLSLVGGEKHREDAERMARSCLAWAGKPGRAPKVLRYAEPACAPEEWGGTAFVEELKKLGADVAPADGPLKEGETLVLGCLLTPRAYTGRIRFDEEGEVAPAQALLSAAKEPIIVAFGSPFVFEVFRGWTSGLCTFSVTEAAQRAAARALMGKIPVTGKMPVRLKLG